MERARFLKAEWLQLLILAAPFIIMAIAWNDIPDRVPMHWGINGHPNGYTSKGIGLFILPIINIGLAALLLWLSKVDPKAYKMKLPGESLKPIRLALTAFLSVLICVSIIPSLGTNVNASAIDIAVAVLILILGNYLPKVKPNYFIGIRTPWALENSENWQLTHEFSGRLWVIASLLFLILIFFIPAAEREAAFLIFIGITILPPYIYSYVLFQKSKRA